MTVAAPWAITHAVHVWPVGDLIEHEQSDMCPCKPAEEVFGGNDGSVRYVFTHHSLDGRELSES